MIRTLFANAAVFDGTSADLQGSCFVLCEGDRLAAVSRSRPAGSFDVEIDLRGRTLMPGLIDAHFHAYAADANVPHVETLPLSYLAHHARLLLEQALMRGFTTIRDAGGADYGLWRAAEEGLFPSPRIFFSGRALSQTGGHGDTRAQHVEPCRCPAGGNLSQIVDGVDAVRAAARETLRSGAHQLKVFVSGGVVSPTDPIAMRQFSDPEIRAIVEEAQSRDTYVMAHAYTAGSIERAVRCGVRSIEHGNLLDASAAITMKEHGAFLVPTLATYDALARLTDERALPMPSRKKLNEVIEAGARAIEVCAKAGVQIGFGTDLLGSMHDQQMSEFRLRSAIEKPVDVLRSATSVNAELINRSGLLGVVREGALADLIVVDGNPLQDLSLLYRDRPAISLVMKAGNIVRNNLND